MLKHNIEGYFGVPEDAEHSIETITDTMFEIVTDDTLFTKGRTTAAEARNDYANVGDVYKYSVTLTVTRVA